MDSVRWGMIGCGKVTEVKSGPAFQKARGSELLAVTSRNLDRAKDYAARHGVPKVHANAAELVADPEIDAVYIATPPGAHLEHVLLAAAAGKAVYVEKPMATTHRDCLEMIAACERHGVPLFVAYYRRALPYFRELKELLDSGAVGEPRTVEFQLFKPVNPADRDSANPPWRLRPELAGDGYFYDVGSHQLDLFDHLFGPVVDVRGVAVNRAGLYPCSDLLSGTFVHASRVVGNGLWNFAAPAASRLDHARIVGTEGQLEFSVFPSAPITLRTAKGERVFDVPYPEHVQQPLVQTIVDELLGRGAPCPSRGDSAARTNLVMERLVGH